MCLHRRQLPERRAYAQPDGLPDSSIGRFDPAARRRIESADGRIRQSIRLRVSAALGKLSPMEAHLAQLSPLKILDRGYAIVENKGKIVKAPEDAPVDSEVNIRVAK